jgi:glucose-1-phosphate adenylyltransferase
MKMGWLSAYYASQPEVWKKGGPSMPGNDCMAMILAGGCDRRLGGLTNDMPQAAVPFCTNSRIIDFPLSNCVNSEIGMIGVFSQYNAGNLRAYIDNLSYLKHPANIHMLPSRGNNGSYIGTANAVYKNASFIEGYQPEDVLVLSGDHVYAMDYQRILDYHRSKKAEVTLAVNPARNGGACRYGMISVNEDMTISRYVNGSSNTGSALASMGVGVFKWRTLKQFLTEDNMDPASRHDFTYNVMPQMISSGCRVLAYFNDAYWQDVGTVPGLWQANMDILSSPAAMGFIDRYCENAPFRMDAPIKIDGSDSICNSMISRDCSMRGYIENSVICGSVTIEKDAVVADSVIMEGAHIGRNAIVSRTIVGPGAQVMSGAYIGAEQGMSDFVDHDVCSNRISLIAPHTVIGAGVYIQENSNLDKPFISYDF